MIPAINPKTTISPIGVYKFDPGEKAYKDALLVNDDPDYVKRELGSLVFVELKVENVPNDFDISDFKQAHTEYVPYDEIFYSLDYSKVLATAYHVPRVNSYIVCFFLHFYDPNQKLITPYGEYDLPPISKLPDRFKDLRYVYWD